MPVNKKVPEGNISSESFNLIVKEYDGRDAFWTGGQRPFKSSITCTLMKSDLHMSISNILSSLVPLKILKAADGRKNLTTVKDEFVNFDDPVCVLFENEVKEAILFLHFGSIFQNDYFQNTEKYFTTGLKNLEKSMKIPGFYNSDRGIKVKKLLDSLDDEYKGSVPKFTEIQRKLCTLNRMIREGLKEHEKETSGQKMTNYKISIVAYTLLFAIAMAYFLL